MRAIVVGAGIGGLTATLSLRRAGHEVTLVEQSRQLTEIGAASSSPPTPRVSYAAWTCSTPSRNSPRARPT